MTIPTPPAAPARSDFVTVLAWIFIVLSGFATAMSVMQNIMISYMPLDEMSARMGQAPADAPLFAKMMIGHIRLMVLLILVLSTTALAAAIGLLKRRNWARLLFIALLALGILWNIGGMAMQFAMFSSFPSMMGAGPPGMPAGFGNMMTMMLGFGLAVAIGFTILFGWIIKRLISPDIRREFGAL